jgi:hypothetical protein
MGEQVNIAVATRVAAKHFSTQSRPVVRNLIAPSGEEFIGSCPEIILECSVQVIYYNTNLFSILLSKTV